MAQLLHVFKMQSCFEILKNSGTTVIDLAANIMVNDWCLPFGWEVLPSFQPLSWENLTSTVSLAIWKSCGSETGLPFGLEKQRHPLVSP